MGWQLFHLEEEIWDGPSVVLQFLKGSAEKKGIAVFSGGPGRQIQLSVKEEFLNRESCADGNG